MRVRRQDERRASIPSACINKVGGEKRNRFREKSASSVAEIHLVSGRVLKEEGL